MTIFYENSSIPAPPALSESWSWLPVWLWQFMNVIRSYFTLPFPSLPLLNIGSLHTENRLCRFGQKEPNVVMGTRGEGGGENTLIGPFFRSIFYLSYPPNILPHIS